MIYIITVYRFIYLTTNKNFFKKHFFMDFICSSSWDDVGWASNFHCTMSHSLRKCVRNHPGSAEVLSIAHQSRGCRGQVTMTSPNDNTYPFPTEPPFLEKIYHRQLWILPTSLPLKNNKNETASEVGILLRHWTINLIPSSGIDKYILRPQVFVQENEWLNFAEFHLGRAKVFSSRP